MNLLTRRVTDYCNKILQKCHVTLFLFAYRVEYFIGFQFHFNEIKGTISFSFLLGQVEREIPGQNTLHVMVELLLGKQRE